MTKMEQLLELIPEETIIESLKQNKGLVDEICAIAEKDSHYDRSAKKREDFILDIMDKCGGSDDCLIYAWYHTMVVINEVPMPLLPQSVIITMPVVRHFLND